MLGLQTHFTKKLLQIDMAQNDWVSQILNLSHIQSCCATLVCKSFFVKCVYKPSIPQQKYYQKQLFKIFEGRNFENHD
jgi:hypothetical protein